MAKGAEARVPVYWVPPKPGQPDSASRFFVMVAEFVQNALESSTYSALLFVLLSTRTSHPGVARRVCALARTMTLVFEATVAEYEPLASVVVLASTAWFDRRKDLHDHLAGRLLGDPGVIEARLQVVLERHALEGDAARDRDSAAGKAVDGNCRRRRPRRLHRRRRKPRGKPSGSRRRPGGRSAPGGMTGLGVARQMRRRVGSLGHRMGGTRTAKNNTPKWVRPQLTFS